MKHAIVVGEKFLTALTKLSEQTGLSTYDVLVRAVATYRTIKSMERDGYKPAMVKGTKATLLKEGD